VHAATTPDVNKPTSTEDADGVARLVSRSGPSRTWIKSKAWEGDDAPCHWEQDYAPKGNGEAMMNETLGAIAVGLTVALAFGGNGLRREG
jgi:hypothetical protein